jgi:hypothetical protein
MRIGDKIKMQIWDNVVGKYELVTHEIIFRDEITKEDGSIVTVTRTKRIS